MLRQELGINPTGVSGPTQHEEIKEKARLLGVHRECSNPSGVQKWRWKSERLGAKIPFPSFVMWRTPPSAQTLLDFSRPGCGAAFPFGLLPCSGFALEEMSRLPFPSESPCLEPCWLSLGTGACSHNGKYVTMSTSSMWHFHGAPRCCSKSQRPVTQRKEGSTEGDSTDAGAEGKG